MQFIIYAQSGPLANYAFGIIRTAWNIQTSNHSPSTCCMMVPPSGWECE